MTDDAVTIGAGTTFTDLAQASVDLRATFALLAQAASWTGSIANQNRGTLGGNCVNASPAADSPPALLVYEAELTTGFGERRNGRYRMASSIWATRRRCCGRMSCCTASS